MGDNIKMVMNNGDNSCQHKFIYGKVINIGFTIPAKVSQKRICSNCGREEIIELAKAKAFDITEYNKVFEKFAKGE